MARDEDWRVKQLPQPLARGNPKRNFLFSGTKAAKGPYQKKGMVGGCLVTKGREELLMVFVS